MSFSELCAGDRTLVGVLSGDDASEPESVRSAVARLFWLEDLLSLEFFRVSLVTYVKIIELACFKEKFEPVKRSIEMSSIINLKFLRECHK